MSFGTPNRTEVFEKRPSDFNVSLEVSAVYVNVEGRCLLLKNGPRKQEASFFGVPAGKLDANETPLAGARRELAEETGIQAEGADFDPLGQLFIRKPGMDYIYHVFQLKLEARPEVILSEEHQSHIWATFGEGIALPLMEGGQEALQYYFRKAGNLIKPEAFSFAPVQPGQRSLVHSWLVSPHAREWFYGEGLQNTFHHLDAFLAGETLSQYWLGLDRGIPFAFFITSTVVKPKDPLTRWCKAQGKTITLDMLIGEANYLGKGLASRLIQEFLDKVFPHADEVLIDPEASNTRAIHVYKKAGFVVLGELIPSHSPNLHFMMRLNRKIL